jgi:hypothetical protein
MIPADVLQNSLILIEQHVDDCTEALEEGDDSVLEAGLTEMREIIDELKAYMPASLAMEIEAKEMGMDSNMEEIAKDVW